MDKISPNSDAGRVGIILVCLYLVSGITSLAYEILWTRMLSIQFGVSIFGVVVTVTAFMAGLGAGSLIGTRWSQQVKSPLQVFAILEFGIAITALLIPLLFQLLDIRFASLSGSLGLTGWLTLQIVVITFVLMVPAFAMGAGFPMILTVVQNTPFTLGGVYGINALGGAIGALLPLWLLPSFGWLNAVRVIAVLGIIVAAVAFFISRSDLSISTTTRAKIARPTWKWLLAYAGIGAGALLLEIGWTRLFGMVMLRTEYVLAIILAVFLVGIGVGSMLAKYLTREYWFTILPILAGTFAIASLWWLPDLSSWVEKTQFNSLSSALWEQGIAIASITLPVTLVLGTWLPLFARKLGDHYNNGVWLYGANSLGAACGAVVAGFVLVPMIGTSSTIIVGSMLLLILGLGWSGSRIAWVSVVILGIASIPVRAMAPVPELLPHAYSGAHDLYLYEDALAITHVVERPDGQRQLLDDLRRMDASSDPTAVVIQKNQARLPLLLHPNPKRVLFLGLGTGISAAGSMPFSVKDRTAVELSAGAINAAKKYFRVVNNDVTDKIKIVRDDARHFLMSNRNYYDVIIGDLFHPDLVGRSALLSSQQFQRAKERLAKGGIFAQWLALNQFDIADLQVILRTFKQVFPNAVMFVDGFRLAMIGTKSGEIQESGLLENLKRLSANQAEKATGGEGPWTWLGRYWGNIPDFQVPIQDEWAPVIEYHLPGARYNGDLDLSRLLSWLLSIRPSVQQASNNLEINKSNFQKFKGAYTATEMAHESWVALLQNRADKGRRLLPQAYKANPRDRWIGFALADDVLADRALAKAQGVSERQLLKAILRIRPDHTEALRGLWHLAQASGNKKLAESYRDRLAALSPLDSALRRSKDPTP
jgi:spermidine synthase